MSIEAQLAIKRNAEELSSYLKDLNSWSNDIKKKDALAKKTKIKKNNYPPIRNTGRINSNLPSSSRPSSPVSTSANKNPVKSEVKKERIKSYDYRSWDSYNVEEELERIDNEDYTEPKPMVEEKEDNDDINEEAIELSLIQKEKGNIMFKKGNYKRAIQYYTKSMELDPTNPVFPLNRAMAYLKLEKYSEAENDCTDCIKLTPKNVKALYRRGLARVGLKKYLEAKSDFETATVLEPSNKQAKEELNKVLAILKPKPKPKEEPKPSSPVNNNPSSLTSSKLKHLKKKKNTITKEQEEKLKNKPVRRRLQIKEVGRSQEEIQKEKEEEFLKQMNEDIKEINELMNNSVNDKKLEEISLTDKSKEEGITPIDMVPVSTTKKIDTNTTKKTPKKMKIVEKDEIIEEVETKKEKEEPKIEESKNVIQEIQSSPETQSNIDKSNELMNKEVDEIITETLNPESLNTINEIPIEGNKESNNNNNNNNDNDNDNSSSKIEIIEEIKEEEDKVKETLNNKIEKEKKNTENVENIENIKEIKEIEEEKGNVEITENTKEIKEIREEKKKRNVEITENTKKIEEIEEEKEKENVEITENIKEINEVEKKEKKIIEEIKEVKKEKEKENVENTENIKEVKKEKEKQNIENIENSKEIKEKEKKVTSEKIIEKSSTKKIKPKVKVATTMFDFERDWKSMRNDDQKTFEYLSSIIPENLPSLFKNSFESNYFSRILVILNKFYIEEEMYDEMYALLNSIQKVNRFEMTLMFMSRKDKQALQKIFDAMKTNQANCTISMLDLESLMKKYKL